MLDFTNYNWTTYIKDSIPYSDIFEEIENKDIAIQRDVSKILFPRNSCRYRDSKLLALLHGSSVDLKKFKCTVSRGNSMLCDVCSDIKDDSFHQLFECSKFNCYVRHSIPQSMHRKLYGLKVLMTPGEEHLKALRVMAQIIFG